MDAHGIILRANQWELDTLGYERHEYVGRHIAEFHVDAEVIADVLERLGRNETLHEYPARLRAKDGSIRHVVINSNVRRGEHGEFVHTRCFTRDVTARTMAEVALAHATTDLERKVAERTAELERANRELERRREQLAEAQQIAQLGSWEWDVASGRVVWSDELLAIFGVVREEIEPTHRAFLERVHPDDLERRREAMERGVTSGAPFAYEFRIVRPDGSVRDLYVRAQGTLGPDGAPVRVVGTAQDVTDAKRADEQRRLFESRLQEAQRLESLGVLAGGIAHDFNNLLVGVLGNASLALAELPEDAPARARIEAVELAGMRAGELTQQLLAYSGQGSFVVEPVDLVGLVQEMCHLLETVVSKKVRLEYELDERRPVIEADATQLRQVVMNLIVNASEACGDERGLIRVHTGVVSADRALLDAFVLADDLPEGEYALLEITDTGSGMSAPLQARIFDPFFTSKTTGRGLGLAGVLGIIRAQRGTIGVESVLGRGSTFTVLLPLSSSPVAPLRTAGEPTAPGAGTILVADDEQVVRDVACAILERAGYDVVRADDGDEAVAQFIERSHDIDAVLLDLMMPARSGAEVLRELRAIRPGLPVVVSSGYTADALDGTEEAVGEVLFVQKPYSSAQLVGAVGQALAAARAVGGDGYEADEPR